MADFKFSCQHCGQHIQLDEAWGGHEIQCPACQNAVVVPQNPAVAAAPAAAGPPPVPSETRLSKSAAAPKAATPAPPQTRFVPRGPQPKAAASNKDQIVKWATIGGVVVALGVGSYFGLPAILKYQDEANAKRREAVKNSDGGEMGHAAELYKVLDATEPGGPGLGALHGGAGHGPSQRRGGAMEIPVSYHDDEMPASAAMPNLPLAAAVWNLDPGASAIPDGRANGRLSGTNFVVDIARVETVNTAHVLRLIQGPLASPDREIMIYLHPKAGESLSGQSWTVSKDMTGSAAPQITKRWKIDPKYAPKLTSFSTGGYAMKLELGTITNEAISGRIFISLPDTDQSVVAGAFNASLVAAAPGAAMAPPPGASQRQRYQMQNSDMRYGKRTQ